jgi:hypothetical protein
LEIAWSGLIHIKNSYFCFSVFEYSHLNIIIMRRLCFLNLLVFLLLSATIPVNTAGAQMPQRGANQVAIIGWTDDSHYQIRNFDSEKKLEIPRPPVGGLGMTLWIR